MKKLLLLTLAACLTFSMALAQQPPNPGEWQIIYGNVDGTPVVASPDADVQIPVWGRTDPADAVDSVTFMHNPLASQDAYISARNGGTFPADHVGLWDDKSFLAPDVMGGGITSQSMLGFAYLTDPRDPQNFFWFPDGGFHRICTFIVHTVADPNLIGQTICPFSQGSNPANGGLLWGMQDGSTGVTPVQTYGCLYFSPYSPSVWTVFPVDGSEFPAFAPFSFHLEGTNNDATLNQVITLVSGPGTFTQTSFNGTAAGDWNGTIPVGPTAFAFDLFDGTTHVPLTFTLVGSAGDLGTARLDIGCPAGIPGSEVWVPVYLISEGLCGGFEILLGTDPTALHLLSIDFTARDDWGQEYNHVNLGADGPGTARIVYIADINNGVFHAPIAAGADPIFFLHFRIDAALPWGMSIPIDFIVNDFTDNTISDQTGYQLIHPPLDAGCVTTVNPQSFKGDPNMNCVFYEVADAVLVARRLIYGYTVWGEDDSWAQSPYCDWDSHYVGNDAVQEAAADLNNNTFADVADLVSFINYLNNGFPKVVPAEGNAEVSLANGALSITSGLEVGAVLVKIAHEGEITNVSAPGMDVLTNDADGVLSVLVYSLNGTRIHSGVVFTFQGEGQISEVSVSDAYGRLMEVAKQAPIPVSYAVSQNYPNPFNAKTQINFALPTASDVTISIYSVTGQLVQTISGRYEAGYQSVTWDASNVSSGIYFYKVQAGDFSQTLKMTLLK